jgi:hypothetical protein
LVFYRAGVADLRKKNATSKGGFFRAELCGLLHFLGSLFTRQALAYDAKNLFCAPLAVSRHRVESAKGPDGLSFLQLVLGILTKLFPLLRSET